jgi:hypothetical protein
MSNRLRLLGTGPASSMTGLWLQEQGGRDGRIRIGDRGEEEGRAGHRSGRWPCSLYDYIVLVLKSSR